MALMTINLRHQQKLCNSSGGHLKNTIKQIFLRSRVHDIEIHWINIYITHNLCHFLLGMKIMRIVIYDEEQFKIYHQHYWNLNLLSDLECKK